VILLDAGEKHVAASIGSIFLSRQFQIVRISWGPN
jgi:hypothetical protein